MIEALSVYIPMDRRQALARGEDLPHRTSGAALFADISGFTPLTDALARQLGPQRGAEELTRHLNLVYDALIAELHRYSGSVVGFSGDAITCWFDADPGLRATACALAMQQAMAQFATIDIPYSPPATLGMKAAVATGPARRFVVGDPHIQVIDVLAGAILDELAVAEHQAQKGEVVLSPAALAALGKQVHIHAWRDEEGSSHRFGVVSGLATAVQLSPWPPLPADALSEEQVRPWLLPPVYERLRSGQGEFLAELRPAVALFLRFGGIDYDEDESAGAKLDAYIRWVQQILELYEGTLIQLTIGDKGSYLYAAFGAPVAHEDDAARAAAAALELRTPPPPLDFVASVQIGMSRGRMRTGAYGSLTRRTYGVLGDQANLAARLMQAAAPGQILASQAAQEMKGQAFAWERLPDIRVKGKTEPVHVFNLIGLKERQSAASSRLREHQYALPMVGREVERGLIAEKLAQALHGQGQLVGVVGEAGIGKSRLVAEAIHMANAQGFLGYHGECQSYGTNTSYLVWQSIWSHFFDLDAARPLDEHIADLKMQLARVDAALIERLPLLGAVLHLPIPDNDLTRSFDARLRKASLEALLVDCLRARARRVALLFVLEDCHWLDPLSQDLLSAIARAIAGLPVLIILAYRPSPSSAAAPIASLPYFTEIALAEFTPQEAERLILLKLAQTSGVPAGAPPALVERITARAEGNPFYIEELLNYLRDRGIDPQDSRALAQLDLPTSLHSLILARIDQLSESQKTTLRVASVVGRLFKAALLWGAYPQLGDPQRIKADLDVLSRLELTLLETEPELTYLFKHIVTHEVAYESLPYAMRAMLHEHIARFIERTAPALDQYLDLLAFHYDRSENRAKKREYLLKAGEAAQAAYANAAAMDYYRRVLPLLAPDEQVAVMLKLGEVLELVGQWAEAGSLYRQALAQAEQLGERRTRARCQTAIGELHRKRGQYVEAAGWFGQALAGFESLGDESGLGQVLHFAGSLAAQQGDYEQARERYQASLAIRRKLGDLPRVAALLSNLGIVARYQGDYRRARALHQEGLAIRRALGDRRAIATSLNNLGNVALDQGDYAEARARLEEAVALQRQVGDRWSIANSLNNLGNVVRAQGDTAAAAGLYTESLTINRELGDTWSLAYLLEDIGALAALEGWPERALRLVGAAARLRQEIGAPLSPTEHAKLERLLSPARAQLDQAAQAAAASEGWAMSLDQACELVLQVEPFHAS